MKTIKIDENKVEVDGVIYERAKRGVWIPEVGDGYYCVSDMGWVDYSLWHDSDEDNYRLNMGNVFKTREEAQKKAGQLHAQARVNQEIREKGYRLGNVDWGDKAQTKWYIYHCEDELMISTTWSINTGTMFDGLKDRESCKALIASHERDIRLALTGE